MNRGKNRFFRDFPFCPDIVCRIDGSIIIFNAREKTKRNGMMPGKNNTGGDWFDKIQAHNRNVYLEQQARAAQETARQAEMDRRQNEEHRRRLEEIEERRAADEAARLQLVKDEREKKEKAKQENARIYALFRRLKEIKEASTPGQKFLLVSELQREADTIDFDAVLDISYKDRFCKIADTLKAALDDLYAGIGDNAVYLKAYDAAMKNFQGEISSLSEIRSFEKVGKAEEIFPELLTAAAGEYNKRAKSFFARASKTKSLFEILKSKSPESCHDRLKEFIALKNDVPASIFSEKGYDSLESVSGEDGDFSFLNFEVLMEFILDDSIPSEELQPLFDFLAEKSSIVKITVETFRRERENEKKILNDMRNICRTIPPASIWMEFKVPYGDDTENPVVATVRRKGTTEKIVFCRDRVQWVTADKITFSVSWDDLINSWDSDYRGGGLFRSPKFRGHIIYDNRCVEIFFKLIVYQQSLIRRPKS